MIGASNIGQQARFWRAVERADMIKTDNEARDDDREREAAVIADIIKTKTADEWEVYFQARHVPAARVRTMAEALADPHFNDPRRVPPPFDSAPGIDGPFGVPLAAFKFAHGGPQIETPPPEFGADTDAVLAETRLQRGRDRRLSPRRGDLIDATVDRDRRSHHSGRTMLQEVKLLTQVFAYATFLIISSSAMAADQAEIDQITNVIERFCLSGKQYELTADLSGKHLDKIPAPGSSKQG